MDGQMDGQTISSGVAFYHLALRPPVGQCTRTDRHSDNKCHASLCCVPCTAKNGSFIRVYYKFTCCIQGMCNLTVAYAMQWWCSAAAVVYLHSAPQVQCFLVQMLNGCTVCYRICNTCQCAVISEAVKFCFSNYASNAISLSFWLLFCYLMDILVWVEEEASPVTVSWPSIGS